MLSDLTQLEQYKLNCLAAAKDLNWENEKERLIKVLGKYAE